MKRQIIAVDIDEVLLPHFQDLIAWYNGQYGTKLTLAHNHPVDPTPWGTKDIAVAVKRVHKFFETDIFQYSKPFDEALDVLVALSKTYDLVIITARDTLIEDLTREWLALHFPGLFKEIQFTAFYSLDGNRRSKAAVAKELNADFLIDDDINHCEAAAKVGIQALLFGKYPWNSVKQVSHPKIIRVTDWAGVKGYFDEKF